MSHLSNKLAEFVFDELSAPEMAEAKRHVAQCSDCRQQVEQFQRTHAMLRVLPDLDPPRHIIFAPPERRSWLHVFDWRLALPVSAAIALIIAALIAVSPAPAPAPIIVSVPAPVPPAVQTQNVDYDRIISELRQSERVWLSGELDKRDKEIQRLRGELAYYDYLQRSIRKETWDNASSIQLLAQRSESRD
jgi:anti-sigma factor RsiW